jgi:hypothetical protein
VSVPERRLLRNGAGETGNEINLPPDCTIILARIQTSEWFHLIVDGEPSPEIVHRNDDFLARAAEFLHTRQIRREIDPATGGGII